MKIKSKKTGDIGQSSEFNMGSLTEIYVFFDSFMDTDYPSEYLFWLNSEQIWVEFNHKKIIPNNINTRFGESTNESDILRGYCD